MFAKSFFSACWYDNSLPTFSDVHITNDASVNVGNAEIPLRNILATCMLMLYFTVINLFHLKSMLGNMVEKISLCLTF